MPTRADRMMIELCRAGACQCGGCQVAIRVRKVATLIEAERVRQDAKWGEQNHTDEWWSAILHEETGELAQAILHDRFGGKAAGTTKAELVQVAAVAFSWLEAIERREAAMKSEKRGAG